MNFQMLSGTPQIDRPVRIHFPHLCHILAEYILRRHPPEKIAKELDKLRVALIGVCVRFKNEGITNRANAKELKQGYKEIIISLRDFLKSERKAKCKDVSNALKSMMIQCVEQFAILINNKVVPNDWLPHWDKASLLRHRADFIRYLCEVFPEIESYKKKCNDAYRIARAFCIENNLKDRFEWIHLNMNYSVFLFTSGNTRLAQVINENILNSSLFHRCDEETQRRLEANRKMYEEGVLTY